MLVNYDLEARRRAKMMPEDRILLLRPKEGTSPLSSSGATDKRLFTGENRLHATYNDRTGMWKLHYDLGGLPGGLQMQFTTFGDLLVHTKAYFNKRNVSVIDVIDG